MVDSSNDPEHIGEAVTRYFEQRLTERLAAKLGRFAGTHRLELATAQSELVELPAQLDTDGHVESELRGVGYRYADFSQEQALQVAVGTADTMIDGFVRHAEALYQKHASEKAFSYCSVHWSVEATPEPGVNVRARTTLFDRAAWLRSAEYTHHVDEAILRGTGELLRTQIPSALQSVCKRREVPLFVADFTASHALPPSTAAGHAATLVASKDLNIRTGPMWAFRSPSSNTKIVARRIAWELEQFLAAQAAEHACSRCEVHWNFHADISDNLEGCRVQTRFIIHGH